jgi:hypothetical protein
MCVSHLVAVGAIVFFFCQLKYFPEHSSVTILMLALIAVMRADPQPSPRPRIKSYFWLYASLGLTALWWGASTLLVRTHLSYVSRHGQRRWSPTPIPLLSTFLFVEHLHLPSSFFPPVRISSFTAAPLFPRVSGGSPWVVGLGKKLPGSRLCRPLF